MAAHASYTLHGVHANVLRNRRYIIGVCVTLEKFFRVIPSAV